MISENLLVDHTTKDDAAIYKVSETNAIVFTTDFFSPVVDDPYVFGQIAAANAISDVYAMGGNPFLALNISCFGDNLPNKYIERILAGGNNIAQKANVIIAGGHTINDSEPKYGLAVIGNINPKNVIKVTNAKPNQDLIITKPIGNGIITTAAKSTLLEKQIMDKAIYYMKQLNNVPSEKAISLKVKAGTDVSGYGLIGHLKNILEGSKISAKLNFNEIPILEGSLTLSKKEFWSTGTKNNKRILDKNINWDKTISDNEKMILFDSQTSGGLLLSVEKSKSKKLIDEINSIETFFAKKIGETIEKPNQQILVDR